MVLHADEAFKGAEKGYSVTWDGRSIHGIGPAKYTRHSILQRVARSKRLYEPVRFERPKTLYLKNLNYLDQQRQACVHLYTRI